MSNSNDKYATKYLAILLQATKQFQSLLSVIVQDGLSNLPKYLNIGKMKQDKMYFLMTTLILEGDLKQTGKNLQSAA